MVISKGKNVIARFFADWLQVKSEELLHKLHTSGIIILQRNEIQRQNKRADSDSGKYVRGYASRATNVETAALLTDCTECFPLQARENLQTLPDVKFVL